MRCTPTLPRRPALRGAAAWCPLASLGDRHRRLAILAGSGRLSLPANLLAKLGGTLGSVLRVSLRPAPTPGPATPAGPGEPAEWVFLCVAGPFPQQHGASSARTAPALLDPSVQLPDSLGRLADPATLARAPASGGRRPPLVHQARVSLLGPPATTAAASCTVAAPPALAASPALPLQLAGRLVAAGCRVLLDPSRGADAAIDVLTTEPPSSAGRGHAVRITPSTHISVVGGAPRGAELPNDAEPASGAGSFRRFAGEAREGSEGGGAGVGRGVDEGSGGEEDQLGESLGKLALTEEPGDANGEERAGGAGEAATGATGAAVTGEWASDATLAGSGEAMASIRRVCMQEQSDDGRPCLLKPEDECLTSDCRCASSPQGGGGVAGAVRPRGSGARGAMADGCFGARATRSGQVHPRGCGSTRGAIQACSHGTILCLRVCELFWSCISCWTRPV